MGRSLITHAARRGTIAAVVALALAVLVAQPAARAASGPPAPPAVRAPIPAPAQVAGTVTGPSGQPLPNICVNVVALDHSVGSTTTGADGRYVVAVPAGTVTALFQDCHRTGPYGKQWWNGGADQSAARTFVASSGVTTWGIDGRMALGAAIVGQVRTAALVPLPGICVVAVGPAGVGGSGRTDGAGRYLVVVDAAGSYGVQFVDCNSAPAYAGRWWHDGSPWPWPTLVTTAAGQMVGNVDTVLAPGTPGSISGRVTNRAGVAMTTACAFAFQGTSASRVAPIAPDGTYRIENLGSGSYYVAFAHCGQAGLINDPVTGRPAYGPSWSNNAAVRSVGRLQGPDPVVQGATPVVVGPGQHLTGYGHCFGCEPVVVAPKAADVRVDTTMNGTFGPASAPGQPPAMVENRVRVAAGSAQAPAPAAAPAPAPTTTIPSTKSSVPAAATPRRDGDASGSGGQIVSSATAGASTVTSPTTVTSAPGAVTTTTAPALAPAVTQPTAAAATTADSKLAVTGVSSLSTLLWVGLGLLGLGVVLVADARRRGVAARRAA